MEYGVNGQVHAGLSITRFWGRNSVPFQMPKSMFFPISRQKIPNLTKKKIGGVGGGGGVLHLYFI